MRLRLTLECTDPVIWRELVVSDQLTLQQLHRIIQLLFGWLDTHLHEFESGPHRFPGPRADIDARPDAPTTADWPIAVLQLRRGSSALYRYDFGDDWTVRLDCLTAAPLDATDADAALPVVLAGERAGPPEDCGGAPGLAQLLDDLAAPRTKAYRERREWLGDAYDPARFDLWQTGRMLTLVFAYGAV